MLVLTRWVPPGQGGEAGGVAAVGGGGPSSSEGRAGASGDCRAFWAASTLQVMLLSAACRPAPGGQQVASAHRA